MHTNWNERSCRPWILMAMVSVFLAGSAFGQGVDVQESLKIELAYIQALTEARMPDYAELVLKDLLVKHPEAKAHLKKAQLELVLQTGKFAEAMEMIRKEPDQNAPETWVMKLTMADYQYAYGQYTNALSGYKIMFDKYGVNPPESISMFYVDSYYKYTQMLLFLNRNGEALQSYENLLKLKLDVNLKRQIQFECAQLIVRLSEEKAPGAERTAGLARAQKIVEELMWIQDLWFGRGIVLLAHIKVLNGNVKDAKEQIEKYMPQLRVIDKQLQDEAEHTGEDVSRLSPVAECRYLMGAMMQDEGERLLAKGAAADKQAVAELLVGALKEMVNVYARYPSSTWAPEALGRSESIQATLKDKLGAKDIRIDITAEQRRTISEKQFANARMLFNQQQFEKAVDAYSLVLSQFPEVIPDSIDALSEYARSYIELSDKQDDGARMHSILCAETIIGHLAERFSGSGAIGMARAGDELLRIGGIYGDRQQFVERDAVYQLFFLLYSDHPMASAMLMAEADKAYKAEDFAGAVPHYTTLMEVYQKSPVSTTAMLRLADCYAKLGSVTNEIAVRKAYVERLSALDRPGQEVISGMYQLARLNRNEAVRALRDASLKFDDARRASAQAEGTEDGAAEAVALAVEDIKRANQKLVASVNEYNQIIKVLGGDRSKYEMTEAEKDRNQRIHQGALFERAYTLTLITQPVDQLPKLKLMAIQGYEMLLEQYPKAEVVPAVLMQMGTLWSTMTSDDPKQREEHMKKADAIFMQLSTNHPDSEQARNAYFLRGRTLIELGFRREGVEVLKKMFSDSGKYSAGQLLTAAEELLKSKELELAREGYNLAVAMAPEQAAILVPAQMGLAQILFDEKRYPEAADALEKFIADNPTSYRVIDANFLLAKASSQAAFDEADRDKRILLFNRAVTAIRAVRVHRKGVKDLAEIEMEVGQILETKADVERKYKNQELVNRYIGEAASHYQTFLMSVDRRNAELFPWIELAYRQSLKLMVEMKQYADGSSVYPDVEADGLAYLNMFPNGRYVLDVQSYLRDAKMDLSTGR